MKNPKENKQLQVGKLYKAKIHFLSNGNALVSGLDGKINYFLMLETYLYETKDVCYSFKILVNKSISTLITFSTKTIEEVV